MEPKLKENPLAKKSWQQHPRYGRSVKVQQMFPEETRTKQAFKDECDINLIVAKAAKVGALPPHQKMPQYGDFSNTVEYREALDTVHQAKEQFDSLPSKIRERFNNNPENFLGFVTNPSNAEEMVKLGLAVKRAPEVNNEEKKGNKKETAVERVPSTKTRAKPDPEDV